MPKILYYYKYLVQIQGEEGLVVDKKYKSMDEIIFDTSIEHGISSRGVIYRIMNNFVKGKHSNVSITKIKELIPHRVVRTVVFDADVAGFNPDSGVAVSA